MPPKFAVWKEGGFRGGEGSGREAALLPRFRGTGPSLRFGGNRTEETGPRPLGQFAPVSQPGSRREERRRLLGRGKMHSHGYGMPPIEGKGPEGVGPYYPYPRAALVSVRRLPPDYLLWSLVSFSYANCCCLGLAALVFSIKSRDAKVLGDVETAEEHGKTARCLNVLALTLGILSIVISIIVLATSMAYVYNRFQEVMADAHEQSSRKSFSSN